MNLSREQWVPSGGIPQGSELLLDCPDCGKEKKFSWNATKMGHAQVGVGQCFSCGLAIEGERSLKKWFKTGATVEVFREFKQPPSQTGYVPAWENAECRAYLEGRNVGQALAEACGALYSAGRVYFPIHSPLPQRQPMMMSRSILPGEKGWRSFPGNRGMYLFGQLPKKGGTIWVTEGVFDCLSSGMWGKAVAILGKVMSPELQWWLLDCYKVVHIWLDPDQAGREGEAQLLEELHMRSYMMEKFDGYLLSENRPTEMSEARGL